MPGSRSISRRALAKRSFALDDELVVCDAIVGIFKRSDQRNELKVHPGGVTVVRGPDKNDHQVNNNRRAGRDDQPPGVGKTENETAGGPNDDDFGRVHEGLVVSGHRRHLVGDAGKPARQDRVFCRTRRQSFCSDHILSSSGDWRGQRGPSNIGRAVRG